MNKRIKVKSYIRKGKVVRSYESNRKKNVLQKVALTIGGIAALTGTSIAALKIKHIIGINNAAKLVKNSNIKLNKINNNDPIVYTVSGLRGSYDDYYGKALQKILPKHNVVSLPLNYNVGNATQFTDAIKKYIKPLMKEGYNPDSLELAKNVYAQHKLNPNNTFYLSGHSAGSVTTNHAQEILKKLSVKVKVVNTGGYYTGLENLSKKDNVTILGKTDHVVKSIYSHNPILIDADHYPFEKSKFSKDSEGIYRKEKGISEGYKQWSKQIRRLIK